MSDYSKITRHPLKATWHKAEWKDNYFGQHRYGVKFPGSEVVYPADQVNDAQLKEFWSDDVLVAARAYIEGNDDIPPEHVDNELLHFLDCLQKAYEARWERDPIDGEGAVSYTFNKYKGDYSSEEAIN